MRISEIHIKGFRNFVDTVVRFSNISLIIGKNDVGKSNLLYALRILFDKKLSAADLELTDSDFNLFARSKEIEITVLLSDITEECIIATDCFTGNISDDNSLYLRYTKSKSEDGYHILAGRSIEELRDIGDRRYIKRLNLKYVDSQRDLFSFYKNEKKRLLQASRECLSDDEAENDEKAKVAIKAKLSELNQSVNSLNFVARALTGVNKVLSSISSYSSSESVRFSSVEQDPEKMLNQINLVSSTSLGEIAVGGDGRNNQIYFATWLTQRELEKDDSSVVFFAIEEPECHLHPHQQRILADYLSQNTNCQVFLTSHSPQIVSRINPGHIIRLTSSDHNVLAAWGSDTDVLEVFERFNYRLNPISSEVFYSDSVFLVEGTSEVLFFRALCDALGIKLDQFNISILSVEGIGFKPYLSVCRALNIPFVIRTDNDIVVSKKGKSKYLAGLSRAVGIVKENYPKTTADPFSEKIAPLNGWFSWDASADMPEESLKAAEFVTEELKKLGIFLSKADLETDLANSCIFSELTSFYGTEGKEELIQNMKNRKAENMFSFLKSEGANQALSKLKDDEMIDPICFLIEKMSEGIEEDDQEKQNAEPRAD